MHSRAEKSQAQSGARPPAPKFSARETLEAIAKPRLTGTATAHEVAAELTQRLEDYGYEVRPSVFHFSSWPGRFGVSLAGAVYLIGVIPATNMLLQRQPGLALVILLTAALVIGAIAVLARPAMNVLPWGRVEGVNLLAHVPGSRPRYYLMAHRDSKSQPIPLAYRGPAIVLAALAWLALTLVASIATAIPNWHRPGLSGLLGVVAAVCGALLLLCWVNNRSPGALDNASGVATLLGVAEQNAGPGDVALIITDAEELGLAGSNAIAGQLPPSFGVINVDGIDDEGGFLLVERFGWPKKKGAAPHLAAALLSAADQLDVPARRRDVPVGLLLDHIPLVRAGIPALTLMKGKLAALGRVHRPADNLAHLKGQGVELAVNLLNGALQQLRAQQKS